RANTIIVSLTLGALFAFVVFGLPSAVSGAERHLPESLVESGSVSDFLHASALMFVAYTGYGRVATLGEEIREPRKNIPRAIVITLLCTMGVYAAVASVAVAAVGADALATATQQAAA